MRLVLELAALVALAAPLQAQQQFAELLTKSHLPPDVDASNAIAIGDVDGDGDLDLVIGNANARNRLYLNDGRARFSDATASRMPEDRDGTEALALVDLDGDGDLDLVIGNGWPGTQNRLYLNDGTGTFADVTAARLPARAESTTSIAVGDVDGDGDPDLVFGNQGFTRLLLNDGTATFSATNQFFTSTGLPVNTRDVTLADLDGDHDLDLFLANQGVAPGGQDRVYANDGTGTFTDVTATRLPQVILFTRSVVAHDLNGDNAIDLVIGTSVGNRLYLNDGEGNFVDRTAGRLPAGQNAFEIAVHDIDGDGDRDLVMATHEEPFQLVRHRNLLYLNDGTGSFTDVTATWLPDDRDLSHGVVVGDLDGDQDPDLAFASDGQNRLYLHGGTTFYRTTSFPLISFVTSEALVAGDVDGDGDADLVAANSGIEPQNQLYLNDGTGAFADGTATRMPRGSDLSAAVALGDADGDGDLDMVFGNRPGYGVSRVRNRLYLNDGTGTFTDVTQRSLPPDSDATRSIAMGDVDGDGDADLVLANGRSERTKLYVNDGAGNYADTTAGRIPNDTDDDEISRAILLADIDADGDLDVVLGRAGPYPLGAPNRLYLNDGIGTFTDAGAARLPATADPTCAVVVGDVDGDGDLDIVWGNVGQNRLWLNDGSGSFTDATANLPTDRDSTCALALIDVDHDGDPDLALAGAGSPFIGRGITALYLNDGTGTFTDVTTARLPFGGSNVLVPIDADGDGDQDLVVASNLRNTIYFNLHRQLSTPFVAAPGQPHEVAFHARPGYATSNYTAAAVLGFGLAPQPIPVATLGTFFLDPTPLVPLPPVSIPSATGTGSVQLPLPANPGLLGLPLHVQGLVVNNADPTDAHFTGYRIDTVTR